MKRIATAAGLVFLAATVCVAQPATNREAAKREIRIADLELAKAVADRSLETFVSMVDEDAVFFGRDTSHGKEAVSKAWLPFFTDRSLFLKWHPTQVEVSSSGDLGYSIGEYERIGKDASGKPETATGSYVSIWRRARDGKWKIAVDIGTPASPQKP